MENKKSAKSAAAAEKTLLVCLWLQESRASCQRGDSKVHSIIVVQHGSQKVALLLIKQAHDIA